MFFILGLLESTALYGFFSLIISSLFLKINVFSNIGVAIHPESLKEVFFSYMIWSIPAYIVLVFLHVLFIILADKFNGKSNSFSSDMIFRIFIVTLTNPFRGLVSLIGAKRVIDTRGSEAVYPWFQVVLHFSWSILLIIWIGIGFIAIAN